MLNKKVLAFLIAGTLTLGSTATNVFAAQQNGSTSGSNMKTAAANLKVDMQNLKAENSDLRAALQKKKSDLGFTQVDKSKYTSELNTLKGLRSDIKSIRQQIAAAKQVNNKEQVQTLRSELQSKVAQSKQINESLAPLKAQLKANKTYQQEFNSLKALLKNDQSQTNNLSQADKAINNDLKTMRVQLKTARQQKDSATVTSLTNSIMSKIGEESTNIAQLISLKQDEVKIINSWQPGVTKQ